MPRIDASTVAEHHDLHFARLLDAALDFVAEHDVASLTLAELAKRTGRSRASLYAYFGSADEMRVALCTRALAVWVDALLDELRLVSNTDERLARFIGAQIAGHRDPTVERVLAFVMSLQSEPHRTRVRAVLEPLTAELLSIVQRLGVEPPTRAATVVQGAIAAAYDQVRAGGDPDEVAEDTIAFVRAGLSALRRSRSTTTPTDRDSDAVVLAGRGSDAAEQATTVPGALAMAAEPSLPVLLAVSLPATVSSHDVECSVVQPTRARVARIAVGQLAWAVVAFAVGATGIGGPALHPVLGLSLVAILIWSVRTMTPARLAPPRPVTMAVLAAVASAVALVGRAQEAGVAEVTHIVLAMVLLIGLTSIARTAWHNRNAVVAAPSPI